MRPSPDPPPPTSDGAPAPAHAPTVAGGTSAGRPAPSGAPAPSTAPADPAVGRFGKYELLAELGAGGMGVVYRARDVELGREVALKTLRLGDAADPSRVERLRREARTAAALSHPGIVPVHDVGAVDGVPYFAMAYVRGSTLDDLARAGRLGDFRERAATLLAVARAVAHAHEHGVVHRDLKPANILVDPDGGVHVTDFGLALQLEDQLKLTATGAMIGTPDWMPPEQIEGDRDQVGPASDVYALGAVLYFLLSGRKPFAGATTTEVLGKALTRDPEALRTLDPRIPADLDTVCRKALDKDPRRRYPTARELADDLDRFVRGEAVAARASGPLTRLGRRVARRKGLAAAATLALAALAWAAWTAGEQDRLRARVLADLREKAGTVLDAALTLRRAGLPADKAETEHLPLLQAALAEAEREGVAGAEGTYHLGRLQRALLRFEEAEATQERALARDPDYAPSRYERAILRARRLDERVLALREQWVRDEGRRFSAEGLLEKTGAATGAMRARPPDAELIAADPQAKRLRTDLAEELRRLDAALLPLPPAQADCIRGLLRLQTAADAAGRDQARALLRQALAGDPQLEEAYEGLARAAREGDAFDEAVAAYDAGIARDRGYAPFWIGRGTLRADRGFAAMASGQDPLPLFRAAEEDLGAAIALVPREAGPLYHRGIVRSEWGRRLMMTGGDAEPRYADAVADFDAAIERDPKSSRAWSGRAHANNHRALVRKDRGEDPDPWFERALADAGKALELSPERPAVWLMRARLRANWALVQSHRGRDPAELHRDAEADYQRALELDPVASEPWFGRAILRLNEGEREMGRGGDPRPHWDRSEADFRAALERDATSAWIWMSYGGLHSARARFSEGRGERETRHHEEAEKALTRALEIDPSLGDAWLRRGATRLNWALWGYFRAEDPQPRFEGALHDFGKAIEVNPRDAEAWTKRGMLNGNWALFLMQNRRDPVARFEAAFADLEKGLELNPAQVEVWLGRGGLRVNWGLWLESQGGDPQPLYAQAVTDHDRALAINPKEATLWVGRGLTREMWAQYRVRLGLDAAELWEAARLDCAKGIEIHPKHAEGWWRRGTAWHGLGRWAEAIADFEEAARVDPRSRENYAALESDARRRLTGKEPVHGPAPWIAPAREAGAAIERGDYAAARALYGRALELFAHAERNLSDAERRMLHHQPGIREELLTIRYNSACIEALASVGKPAPGAPVRELPPEEAAACRDAAFAHLAEAIDLGWEDRGHLERDADLVALRGDPRWAEMIGRIGK